jgi:hypothetical protein
MSVRRHLPAFLALLVVAPAARAQSNNAVDKFWVTDGGVAAIEDDGTRVFVGGKFSRVAPRSGSSVRIDAATGVADSPFPMVRGVVNAVVPDGAGGWFLGGSFDRVGDRFRNNIAHVLADGRVGDWESNVNGPVFALAREPGWLYVGGTFTMVTGQPRNNLARVDTSFGQADPTWDPNVIGSVVRALVLRQGLVYLGGTFTTVNGATPRNNAAAVRTSDGLATPWNPNPNGPVYALAVPTSVGFTDVYLGGGFTTVNGAVPAARLAKVDSAGVGDPSWTPTPNADVYAVAVPGGGGIVYAGGAFSNAGGQPRANVAAIDAGGNAIATWNPGANGPVDALALRGFQLFLGGRFTQVAGQPRHHLALVDDPSGALLPWDPHAFGPVAALAFSARPAGPDWVYAGGSFSAVNGAARSNLAAFLKSTGDVDPAWLPEADGAVHALTHTGSLVYVGGEFTNVGGQLRRCLAAVDDSTGSATSWNPDVSAGAGSPAVLTLGFDFGANRVYVGGVFTLVNGGLGRLNAAAFDLTSGVAATWDPRPDNRARQLSVLPGVKVELAGDFTQVGSPPVAHPYFAAVDPGPGLLLPFNANPNTNVHAFFTLGSDLYLAGGFTLLGTPAQSRNRAGAVNAGGGATPWDPNVGGGLVNTLVQDSAGSAVLGGSFIAMGAAPRNNLAQVDLVTGLASAWNPDANGGNVVTALPRPAMLFAGGDFQFVSGRPQRSFAAFCKAATVTGVTAAPAGPNSIQVNWVDTGVPLYHVYRSEGARPYVFIGAATSGSTGLIDFDAEGGITYAYSVRAVQGGCESDLSTPAAFAVTTGPCGTTPFFDGAGDAIQAAGSACRVQVLWGNAIGRCGESPTFSVYRSTSPTFIPDADNRFAQGISGFGWLDQNDLAPSGTYYYIVRALDPASGEEDANEVRVEVTLSAGCLGGTPPPVDALTTRARAAENRVEWVYPLGFGSVELRYDQSALPNTPCTPPATVGAGTAVPGSPFPGAPNSANGVDHLVGGTANDHNFCYSAFVIGAGVSDGVSVAARPAAVPAPVRWSYTAGASALSRPAVMPLRASFGVSNDRKLHALQSGPTGGAWPTTPAQWQPQGLDAAALGRPTVVEMTTTQVLGHRRIAVVGTQDGRVYCFAADTGALLWVANGGAPLGEGIVTPPSIMVQDFGTTPANLVFVGTRNTAADNRLVALHLSSGALAWTFDNGGGPGLGIGIISGQPLIEYGASPKVYFASRRRAGGANQTVWAVNVGPSSGTLAWREDRGEIDGAPTRRAGALYVGNNIGEVFSLSTLTGGLNWSVNLLDGPIKGFVWPDGASSRLYVSTTNAVHALTDGGGGATAFWLSPLAIPLPSTPLVLNNVLYVGAGNGRLYSAPSNVGGTPPIPTSVLLGDPTIPKNLGTPAYDRGSSTTTTDDTLVVGTDEGRFYAVSPPF